MRAEVLGDAWSCDIAPDGSLIAGLRWWGASSLGAHCAVVDARTGTPRALTGLTRRDGSLLSGGEEIRFSPDSRWLLATTPVEANFITLIEIATGRIIDVQCPGVRSAGWWPQRSPASLMVAWIGSARDTVIGALDLSSGRLEELGRLALPAGVRDSDEYVFGVNSLVVGPDGSSLLGLTFTAPGNAWSLARKPRARIAHGVMFPSPRDGIAGRIERVDPAFLDAGGAAIVEQRRPHWIDGTPGNPVMVAADLLATARGPIDQPPPV